MSVECKDMLVADESSPLEPAALDTVLFTVQLEWVVPKFTSIRCGGCQVEVKSHQIPALPGATCRLGLGSNAEEGNNSGYIFVEIKGLEVGLIYIGGPK